MITIRSRRLLDLAYLPDLGAFTGQVALTYSFPDDPGAVHTARVAASADLDHRTRFARIEAALLSVAEGRLLTRMSALELPPMNIFQDSDPGIRAA